MAKNLVIVESPAKAVTIEKFLGADYKVESSFGHIADLPERKMGIDTQSVLKAAGTKWNFLKFFPGLVGGHCIGVDPYYLTYKAEQLGYHSQIILSGRRINDDMGKYVAESVVKNLIKADVAIKSAKVAILGFTF